MEAHLRAGVAVYNAGEYHAAHDAWEDHWLDLEQGTDDELFLHGLIQFTAAVFHATNRNWSGAVGLAESGKEYLAGLPDSYRGVDVEAVRRFLVALADDPELSERREPPALTHRERAIELADLNLEATLVAAHVLAEEHGYEDVVDPAIAFARTDRDRGETGSEFVSMLFDFVRDSEHRSVIVQRLSEHVERRQARDADVDGLFE